jgi:molybdenum cofactor cytidylyltransferase
MINDLREALRLGYGSTGTAPRIAFVGAGGKTTAIFQLAHALAAPVVVTTTTHLGTWQAEFADRHLIITRPHDLESFSGQIEGVTLLTGPITGDDRLEGLDEGSLEALRLLAEERSFPILIEADGSRQRALKVPGPHEPVIPEWVDAVVVVAGLSGLNRPLDEQSVHRPDLYALMGEILPGDKITSASLMHVLTNPLGGLKRIPSGARKIALLNQAGSEELAAEGAQMAWELIGIYDSTLVTSLAEHRIYSVMEPVVGIVLAGGSSSRFGKPKMLLPWKGKPLIRYAVEAALEGGLSEVVVVRGAVNKPLERALASLPVRFVENPEWQAGLSASVRAGVGALPEGTGSAMFLLADQPFVSADLVRALAQRHSETLAPIVAPRVEGKRGNPVLFDRSTFRDLLTLEGDTGGRAIIERSSIEYLDWDDPAILQDIDTPEDYEQLLKQE